MGKVVSINKLSTNDTDVLKGLGILMLLTFHLFHKENVDLFYDIVIADRIHILREIGLGQLCVSIFVFLSGYGLTVQANKGLDILKYYYRRFLKLYLNYWLVWIIFVPIGIFVFGITFSQVYQDHIFFQIYSKYLRYYYFLG